MDDERRVDEFEGFADVVIRNKHPDSPSGELSHQLANITDRNRINSGERLVEEHELGARRQGRGRFPRGDALRQRAQQPANSGGG